MGPPRSHYVKEGKVGVFHCFTRCVRRAFLARAANKEDDVKGRFWESRFKCRPLLDVAAIASCMVYVDLNPIRAGLAATPEQSDFTSIQERILAWHREMPSQDVLPGADKQNADARINPILESFKTNSTNYSPASSAAPRHAPSVTCGTRNGMLQMSALSCSHWTLRAPPPTACKLSMATPDWRSRSCKTRVLCE